MGWVQGRFWQGIGALIVCAMAGCATFGSANAEPLIEWRVENPFRFFLDAEATARQRAALLQGRADRRATLAAERWMAERAPGGWAEPVFLRTCWDLLRQDHSACGGLKSYVFPKTHRVLARLADRSLANATCAWRIEAGRRRVGSVRRLRGPCAEPIAVDVPYPAGATLTAVVQGRRVASAIVRVKDLFIVGLGDSYASGEGNPDRPVRWRDDRSQSFGKAGNVVLAGYPARKAVPISYRGRRIVGPSAFWLSQPCHRSLYSYQLRVAMGLAVENPHRAVTFLGLSCSGAKVANGLLGQWKGVEKFVATPKLSQVGQAAVAQCGGRGYATRSYASSFTDGGRVPALDGLTLERCPPNRARKVDLVMVSIGGNDIDFAKLVAYAILRDRSPLRRLSEVTDQVVTPRQSLARFRELRSRYKMLRRALHNHLHIPWEETARIILTAYPKIAMERDGRTVCEGDNQAGLDGFPGYRLDRRRTAAAEGVSERLTQLMRSVSRAYGWTFVAEHRDWFAGRGLCAGVDNGGRDGSVDELMLPRWTGARWTPHRPSLYRPYAPRRRWMRTSNDSFMTTHVDLVSDVKRRFRRRRRRGFSPADLLKASTFGGAFHPTAEGHARDR